MTVVCAWLNDAACYVAADQLMTKGSMPGTEAFEKGFCARSDGWPHDVYIFVSGSALVQEICRDEIGVAFINAKKLGFGRKSDFDRLAYELTECLRARFARMDWKPQTTEGSAPWYDVSLLMTDGHQLVEVDTTLWHRQISSKTFVAIGRCDQAYGVAWMYKHHSELRELHEAHPHAIVTDAVAATIAYDVYCGGEPRLWRIPALPPKTT